MNKYTKLAEEFIKESTLENGPTVNVVELAFKWLDERPNEEELPKYSKDFTEKWIADHPQPKEEHTCDGTNCDCLNPKPKKIEKLDESKSTTEAYAYENRLKINELIDKAKG